MELRGSFRNVPRSYNWHDFLTATPCTQSMYATLPSGSYVKGVGLLVWHRTLGDSMSRGGLVLWRPPGGVVTGERNIFLFLFFNLIYIPLGINNTCKCSKHTHPNQRPSHHVPPLNPTPQNGGHRQQ